MASQSKSKINENQECIKCFRPTKYSCITCVLPVCNLCSTPETDDAKKGWIVGKRVGYCGTCHKENKVETNDFETEAGRSSIHEEILSALDDHESSDDEIDSRVDHDSKLPCKNTKQKAGRKAKWSNILVDDMVDIIVNNDYYKKRLIFVNVKNQKNSDIYQNVLKELKNRAMARGEDVPFTSRQLRTKFKKAIAECKKAALTIKTSTGIKRFQEDKGYGSWFDQLFSLVKTRDSCQPEQAIEPCLVQSQSNVTINPFLEESEPEDESEKNLFVPVKNASRKRKKEDKHQEILEMMKKICEKDPMKEYIQFAREEAERSRQHEARMMEMMCSQMPTSVFQQMQSPLSYGVQFQTNIPPHGNENDYDLFKL